MSSCHRKAVLRRSMQTVFIQADQFERYINTANQEHTPCKKFLTGPLAG